MYIWQVYNQSNCRCDFGTARIQDLSTHKLPLNIRNTLIVQSQNVIVNGHNTETLWTLLLLLQPPSQFALGGSWLRIHPIWMQVEWRKQEPK